jgi:hypothetical protein
MSYEDGGHSARVFCGRAGQLAGYAISDWPARPRFSWGVEFTRFGRSQSVFSVFLVDTCYPDR